VVPRPRRACPTGVSAQESTTPPALQIRAEVLPRRTRPSRVPESHIPVLFEGTTSLERAEQRPIPAVSPRDWPRRPLSFTSHGRRRLRLPLGRPGCVFSLSSHYFFVVAVSVPGKPTEATTAVPGPPAAPREELLQYPLTGSAGVEPPEFTPLEPHKGRRLTKTPGRGRCSGVLSGGVGDSAAMGPPARIL
jgi:hypothetical protein